MTAPRIESQVSTVNLGNLSSERRGIDREKTCPMLIRTFCTVGRHVSSSDYSRGVLPPAHEELHIHTWMDATLKELSNLIREMKPEARKPGTRMEFHVLYPEQNRRGYRSRTMGEVFVGGKSEDFNKTLEDVRFQSGDILDVCIFGRGEGRNKIIHRDRDRDRENKRR